MSTTTEQPKLSPRGVPQPLLHTDPVDFNGVERAKLAGVTSAGVLGELVGALRDRERPDVDEAAEHLAKSHGIYLEYNRAKTGRQKDWMYMVRVSVPGGGPFDRKRWLLLDDIAAKYARTPSGASTIRLTTRQNVQFHWVAKENLVPLVREVAQTGFFTLNGCGDNVRNVMGCPLSRFSRVYDAWSAAQRFGKYFELPVDAHIQIFEVDTSIRRFDGTLTGQRRSEKFDYAPHLLNRKFKIAFSAVHRNPQTGALEPDNCVELRTNDLGVAPIVENDRVVAFQVYIGGGQGEKNGKASAAMLGLPVGVFAPENLAHGLDSIVKVHQEWGDRKNRHWARLKYVVRSQGIEWFQDRLRERAANFAPPDPDFHPGPRRLHHGWQTQESDDKLAYGLFVECGRLIDRDGSGVDELTGAASTSGGNEKLLSLVRALVQRFNTEVMITPNQDLLFTNIDPTAKEDFQATMRAHGHGTRNGRLYSRLRLGSGACVGLPTCRLSYTDSEQFLPVLIDQLETMGYGDLSESIGITGCERQCFRPATKSIGWVGQGPDMYMLKVGGDEAGRHQGTPLVEGDKLYLRQVPREAVATVCSVLFDHFLAHREEDEDLGAFHRRIGHPAILDHLRTNPRTAAVAAKAAPAPYIPEVLQ